MKCDQIERGIGEMDITDMVLREELLRCALLGNLNEYSIVFIVETRAFGFVRVGL